MLGPKSLMRLVLALAVLSVAWASPALGQDDPAGGLRNVKGDAWVERQGGRLDAENGMYVFIGDDLVTGADGAMGIIFEDNTRMSLGPESRLNLEEFIFAPAERDFSMIMKVMRGTASYQSGGMAKLAPEAVSIRTPSATIGVRGTSFLVKVEE